jgi:uncharacterized protein (DUF779 family)
MRGVTNSRWLRIGLAILLTLQGGCANRVAKPCPPVADFPPGLADRVETLDQNDPVFMAMGDYYQLWRMCR